MLLNDRLLQFGSAIQQVDFFEKATFSIVGSSYASIGFNHKVTESSVLSGNVQFDNYSDFESSRTYDFRVRTSISDNFSVHGKYGTGFAPKL